MHSVFPYSRFPTFKDTLGNRSIAPDALLAMITALQEAGDFSLWLYNAAQHFTYIIFAILNTIFNDIPVLLIQKRTAAARARPTTKLTLYVCLQTDPLVFVLADKQTDRQQTEHEDKRSVSLSAKRRLSQRAHHWNARAYSVWFLLLCIDTFTLPTRAIALYELL